MKYVLLMTKNKYPSTIKIIGGKWRGRKLQVPTIPGLRPTPNRVRETLFNWLVPIIQNAACLDLFAGSGALSFEALSRGAATVTLIDSQPAIIKLLRAELTSFDVSIGVELGKNSTQEAKIYCGHAPEFISQLNELYDIVFIDPPFHENLILPTCHALELQQCLSPVAYIYIEAEKAITAEVLPTNWQLIKYKKTGLVHYHLAKRSLQ